MSHEPECPVVTFWLPVLAECRCDILRPAYQRGRVDAANDVADMKPYILITVIDEQRAYVSKSEAYGEALGSEK